MQKIKILILEEFERLAFDQFILLHKIIVDALFEKCIFNEKIFSLELFQLWNTFVNKQSSHGSNEYTKHTYNFIIMSNKFRIFWNRMRNIDRVAKESIMLEFLEMFHFLGKTKYFDIGLNQIDLDHRKI